MRQKHGQLTPELPDTWLMGTSRGARILSAQDGMTLTEVVVAALVLTVGSLAVLSLLGASARNSYRADQSQVVDNRLQDE
ncbi:MAG: hypothetical protein ACJ75Z_04605, partial [Solirubrobacterales bacterium]